MSRLDWLPWVRWLGQVVATGKSRDSVRLWFWFPTTATLGVFLDLHVSVYKCVWQQIPLDHLNSLT